MLNKTLIIESINCHIENLMNNKIDNFFKIKRLIEQINELENDKNPFELLSEGGSWLGAVRRWIQRKCLNGEFVDWGSNEYLKFNSLITVRDMEHLSAVIASEARKYK